AQIEIERDLLPWLRPQLPIAIPEIVAVGEPAPGYPWRWAVYRWLDGVPPSDGTVQLAHDLAAFIAALQRIDAAGGRLAPPPGGALALRDTSTREAIAQLHWEIDVDAAVTAWETALATPAWSSEPVWLHGDILEGNLLVRDGRLSGVIDWGCACVGDPAF